MKCEVHNNKDVIKRLNRLQGQIGGIKTMIEDNRTCEEVLVQISAVNSALHKVAQMVLEDHLGHCVVRGIETGKKEESIEELIKSVEQYSRIK